MSESLFGRIARHATSPSRDPREDRLTEVFAAVLGASQAIGLARYVASRWLTGDEATAAYAAERLRRLGALLDESEGDWSCSVRTQLGVRTKTEGRRLDLALHFERHDAASSSDEHVLLWIEVKHGTNPSNDQLAAYLDQIKLRSVKNAAVLLLAPRSGYPTFDPAQMPAAVPRLTWEETGRIIGSFEASDPVTRFLLDELIEYLREEALMDPPRLRANTCWHSIITTRECALSRASATWPLPTCRSCGMTTRAKAPGPNGASRAIGGVIQTKIEKRRCRSTRRESGSPRGASRRQLRAAARWKTRSPGLRSGPRRSRRRHRGHVRKLAGKA